MSSATVTEDTTVTQEQAARLMRQPAHDAGEYEGDVWGLGRIDPSEIRHHVEETVRMLGQVFRHGHGVIDYPTALAEVLESMAHTTRAVEVIKDLKEIYRRRRGVSK